MPGVRVRPLLWAGGLFMVAVSSFLPIHRYPQTVFLNEWMAVLGLAFSLLPFTYGERQSQLPRLTLNLSMGGAGLALCVFGVSFTTGNVAGTGLGCYLFVLSMALLSGGLASSTWSRGFVVQVFAAGFLVVGILQTLAAFLQIMGIGLDGLIMPKLYNAAYGNIAQPNHLASILWMSAFSLVYLCGRVGQGFGLAVVVPFICLASAMSASRAAWVYMAFLFVLSVGYRYLGHGEGRERIFRVACWVVCVALGIQLLFALTDIESGFGLVSSASRLADASSNGQRLFDWWVALVSALQHPWGGVGVGQFAWQTALRSIGLPPPDFIRIGENAHNTLLHFAAEWGLVPVLLLLILLALFIGRMWWRGLQSDEHYWLLGVVGVIVLHSMVEYPLWYTYFLIPFGVCLGALKPGGTSVAQGIFPKAATAFGVIVLMIGAFWSLHDYSALERAYARFPYGATASDRVYREAREISMSVSDGSPLAAHARALQIRAWPQTETAAADEVAELCRRYLRFRPNFQTLTQCAFAYAHTGQEWAAVQTASMVCGAYPAIYHGSFPVELRGIFQRNGWAVRSEMHCIR